MACKKEHQATTYNSSYVVKNRTLSMLEIHTSLHQTDNTGTATEIDFLSAGNSLSIKNEKLEENASIRLVFHDIRIFQNGMECAVDELNNASWGKQKIGDDKIEYTLSVDSTFFH